MKASITREQTDSVTNALIKAMENAERMKNVVIIYETTDDMDTPHGLILNGSATIAQINWLLDIAKDWLMNC